MGEHKVITSFVCSFLLSRSFVLKAIPEIVINYSLGIRAQRRKWTVRNLDFCDMEIICSICIVQVLTVKPVKVKI